MSRRSAARADLIKLSAFLAVCLLITGYLVVLFAELRPGRTHEFHATFSNVSGLQVGDQVRAASVTVGKVAAVDPAADGTVRVTFTVEPDVDLDTTTTAVVQYKNLIGDRLLALFPGEQEGEALAIGDTIPIERTSPAVDLDTLLQGFKPLFVGLNPQQINDLSGQLIEVLQGQAGAVQTLVSSVASVTGTLADREDVIGQVIDNLNLALGTVDERRDTLDQFVVQLTGFVDGLSGQATEVLDAAARIDAFAADTSDLLARTRDDVTPALTNLAASASGLNSETATLVDVLNRLPGHYERVVATGSYGNFFNFFLCGVRIQVSETDGQPVAGPWIISDTARCQR